MNYKEIWFIRHTETVTPDSYDFDLSRKGKRDARIIGWHMARQNILTPALLIRLEHQRAKSMADNLLNATKNGAQLIKEAVIQSSIPSDTLEAFKYFMNMILELDKFSSYFNECSPQTAILITHAEHDRELNLLRFILAKQTIGQFGAAPESVGLSRALSLTSNIFTKGEVFRIRFPVETWSRISVGSGELMEHTGLKNVRAQFRSRRRQNTPEAV